MEIIHLIHICGQMELDSLLSIEERISIFLFFFRVHILVQISYKNSQRKPKSSSAALVTSLDGIGISFSSPDLVRLEKKERQQGGTANLQINDDVFLLMCFTSPQWQR